MKIQHNVLILLWITFITPVAWAGFLPTSFEADFEQVTKSLRREKVSPVKIFYKFQSNIFFKVSGDTPVTYICNKKKVWIYNPPFIEGEAGELMIGDSSKYCYSKFFDALSKGLDNNVLYKVKKNNNVAVLNFGPDAAKQLSIQTVTLVFKENINRNSTLSDLNYMDILKVNEKRPVKLKLKKMKTGVSIQDSKFIFNTPQNTNVKLMK